jgi:sortase (surface protein transpeptidase)
MALEVQYTKERHPGRWVAVCILIAIIGAGGWFGYEWYQTGNLPFVLPLRIADTAVDESTVSDGDISAYTVPALQPRYIRIPSLDVANTRIYAVGLDNGNLLESPSNLHDATWYKKSATPGSGGVMIIDGHSIGIDHDGVFKGLKSLKKDESIIIQRGDGHIFTYKVVENASVSLDEFTSTGMKTMGRSADPGTEALNIITFDGIWVPRLGTFDKRIMVRAIITQ